MKLTIKPRLTHLVLLLAVPLAASSVRIIQTNSAGDDVHVIDPATNKVVGVIHGIEVNHGAASAPDGLAAALGRGEVPDFLERVALDGTNLLVLRPRQ